MKTQGKKNVAVQLNSAASVNLTGAFDDDNENRLIPFAPCRRSTTTTRTV